MAEFVAIGTTDGKWFAVRSHDNRSEAKLVPSQSEKWGKDHAMCTPASRGRAEMDGFRHPCISR